MDLEVQEQKVLARVFLLHRVLELGAAHPEGLWNIKEGVRGIVYWVEYP
jgi:hypothetical protein